MGGVTPDITCLGKIIGGGLPVGAYGGRREIMSCVAPVGEVYQAGTLSGNPLAMSAGITTLNTLKDSTVYQQLEATSAAMAEGLQAITQKYQIPCYHNRVGSMLSCFFYRSNRNRFCNSQDVGHRAICRLLLGLIKPRHLYRSLPI